MVVVERRKMAKIVLTKDLYKILDVGEFDVRNAIRAGHIKSDKLSNGLMVWNPEQVKAAKKFFKNKKKA